jgi:diguanylate cyclase (GGDEF)-like protein/PAS domain S-box-containing protein
LFVGNQRYETRKSLPVAPMLSTLLSTFERYKIETAFLSAIAIMLAAGYFAYRAQALSKESFNWVQHTYEVLDTLDRFDTAVAMVQSSSRGYALTGKSSYLDLVNANASSVNAHLLTLRKLTQDNGEQQAALLQITPPTLETLRRANQLIAMRRAGDLQAAARALATVSDREELQAVTGAVETMKAVEENLLATRRENAKRHNTLSKTILVAGTLVGIIITASAGIGVISDVYRRRRAEAALFIEKERAEVTLRSIADGVIRVDAQSRVTFLNRAAEAMTGWPARDALGLPVSDIFCVIDADSGQPVSSSLQRAIDSGRTLRLPERSVLICRDGSKIPIEDVVAPIRNSDGTIEGAVKVFRDVSSARELTRRLEYSAQHDVLTGLPNRALLADRIEQAIRQANREGTKMGLLFLDLDGFKQVNDEHGHRMGDRLLKSISMRLCKCVRESDTVSRLGGDEFVVLLGNVHDRDEAGLTAYRILRDLSQPHTIDGARLGVTVSIGVSIFPDDGRDGEALMRRADQAMYRVKSGGRNQFAFFGDAPQQDDQPEGGRGRAAIH